MFLVVLETSKSGQVALASVIERWNWELRQGMLVRKGASRRRSSCAEGWSWSCHHIGSGHVERRRVVGTALISHLTICSFWSEQYDRLGFDSDS